MERDGIGPMTPRTTCDAEARSKSSRVERGAARPAHPHMTGADLVLTYSTNSLDFGDQFREDWLYFPRFVRLTGMEK